MAEYFIDPYTKYYSNLEVTNTLNTKITSIGDELKTISDNITNLDSQITMSRWEELGQREISTKILPTMAERIKSISNDVNDVLQKVVTKAKEIYEKTKELKEQDEKLEAARKELEALKASEPAYSNNNSSEENAAHSAWKLNVTTKDGEINSLVIKCDNLKNQINSLKDEINSLEISKEPEEVVKKIKDDGTLNINLNGSDGMIDYNFEGKDYLVADTKLSLNDYAKIIQRNHIAQRFSSAYNDKCLGFSSVHAGDLYTGRTTSTGDDGAAYHSAVSLVWDDSDKTWSKTEALKKVYNEISNGRPVVMQVNGARRKNGSWGRHFVTVVGVKKDAAESGVITEDDLLIIDSYDGNIESMDKDNSRFMTRGADTGNGNYGYYILPLNVKTQKA